MEGDSKPGAAIWLLIIIVLVGFAAALTYFGKVNPNSNTAIDNSFAKPTVSRQARVYTVYYGFGVFSPTNIRVHIGDSVRFQNDGSLPIRIVSSTINGVPELPGFDSVGDVPSDGAFTYTFNKDGIFGYHNANNLAEEGTVIVRPQY
ncbi:MAG: hypothetical protein WED06_00540 [Candidatus Paceibacterota bacterium]